MELVFVANNRGYKKYSDVVVIEGESKKFEFYYFKKSHVAVCNIISEDGKLEETHVLNIILEEDEEVSFNSLMREVTYQLAVIVD
jgi:hypothetical protein